MSYETLSKESFREQLLSELRIAYDSSQDLSLVMVKIEDNKTEETFETIESIADDIFYLPFWVKYNDTPVFATYINEEEGQDKTSELVSRIKEKGFEAEKITYNPKRSDNCDSRRCADNMIEDLACRLLPEYKNNLDL